METIMKIIESALKTIVNNKVAEIEYVKTTLSFGLKGMGFIIKLSEEDIENGETRFFKLECKNRCKKTQLNEKQIMVLGYLNFKKKIINKNKYLLFIFYGILLILLIAIFFINKKLFFTLGVLAVIGSVGYSFLKKYIYKFYNKIKKNDE